MMCWKSESHQPAILDEKLFLVTYLLNRVPDDVPEDCDPACLSHTNGSGNSLLFHGRVPLRLDEMDVVGGCQVKSVRTVSVE